MRAWYNEIDPYAAAWLRNLIAAGHIAPGDVDERDIRDVRADDLHGYTQCHFFAGIGGWSVALRLAGWPDDRLVWTGSCPCQPFSTAGKGKAGNDERHLWPAWSSLIAECRPGTVFGEQVEAAIGWGWLDLVFADLEKEGYACGAAVLPACSVGAPHIRNRLWFVAQSSGAERGSGRTERAGADSAGAHAEPPGPGPARLVADAGRGRLQRRADDRGLAGAQGPGEGEGLQWQRRRDTAGDDGPARLVADASGERERSGLARGDSSGGEFVARAEPGRNGLDDSPARLVADADRERRGEEGHPSAGKRPSLGSPPGGGLAHAERDGGRPDEPQRQAQGREADGGVSGGGLGDAKGERQQERRTEPGAQGRGHRRQSDGAIPARPAGAFWSSALWLPCTDGKARPVEPGVEPLVDGLSFRVGSGSALAGKSRAKMLRAFGNAIVPPLAAEFIAAYGAK